MSGHHGPPGPPHQLNGHMPPGMGPLQQKTVAQALASANEAAWIQLGKKICLYAFATTADDHGQAR